MVIVISLLIMGWVVASVIGTQAYFLGEQTKPIHARNWNSSSFESLSESITGKGIDHANRTPSADVLVAFVEGSL
ncbi:MAG: hypothetical protein VKL00_13170 [Synechococcales bacterium]|jgi:hypothetical protein|nr:hypothetical protein [Cyanobacteria bacterium REEB444]MEB3126550.1 hypothetical protein [Synechococcales bacterium]NBO30318.1 hypothetical protein [Cyanobacteria bacterium WB6_1B_304]